MPIYTLPIETDVLCSYGCGRVGKHQTKSGKIICEESHTKCPVLREKNCQGTKRAYKQGIRAPVKYKDLPQSTKDRIAQSRAKIPLKVDFSYNGKGRHKKALIQERGHTCESCKENMWLGEPIPLELEHCDGDNKNNVKDNLLLLCPNCHARTKYYRGRNINTGKVKVTDAEIYEQIEKGLNTRQISIAVGLTPKGANYARVNKLIMGPLNPTR